MSRKEIDRYEVVCRVIRKEITAQKGGELAGLSKRQIKRLKQKVRQKGAVGLIHGNRGKPSNNALPPKEREKIVSLLHARYADFKPTFACEKLIERHNIVHDAKTIRSIQIAEGLWTPRQGKQRPKHRSWRARKECLGEMLQFDGSYHDWFVGRGERREQCLLAAIDDATGRVVQAMFAAHEGVMPVMGFWKEYVLAHGKPHSIYLDKFSTYKVNHKVAQENPDVKTQFQRVCNDLGIQPIFANSPQAKGRVERLFSTFQDRLVKEMRLADISTTKHANQFLKEFFLPKFNVMFSVPPVSKANVHRILTREEKQCLDSTLSRHTQRTVQNDFTFSFNNQWYQITATQSVVVGKKDVVTVEEYLDGTIHLRLRGKYLHYELLPARPKKTNRPIPWALATQPIRAAHKPTAHHPWRRPFLAKVPHNARSS